MYKILSLELDPLSVCSHLYMRIYMCGCVFEIRKCGEFAVLKYLFAEICFLTFPFIREPVCSKEKLERFVLETQIPFRYKLRGAAAPPVSHPPFVP